MRRPDNLPTGGASRLFPAHGQGIFALTRHA